MLLHPATATAPARFPELPNPFNMLYADGPHLHLYQFERNATVPAGDAGAERGALITSIASENRWTVAGLSVVCPSSAPIPTFVPCGKLAVWAPAANLGTQVPITMLDAAGVMHGDAVTTLSIVGDATECCIFSAGNDGSMRRTLVQMSGVVSAEFPRAACVGAHTRAVTAVDAAFVPERRSFFVLTGSKDRTVRMWSAGAPDTEPALVPVTMSAVTGEQLTHLPPPNLIRGAWREAAADLVPQGKARVGGGGGAQAGEGFGWGEGLLPQEVVAIRRFTHLAHNYVAVAYADGTVITYDGGDRAMLLPNPDGSGALPYQEATMVGAVRYDGDAAVRLTAFAVWTPSDREERDMPHFLLGFSDGTVELKAVGFLSEVQMRLTPLETAFKGPDLFSSGGGGGGGGRRGGGRHHISALAPLGKVVPDHHGRLVAAFSVGCTNEEGRGWYSVFMFYYYLPGGV
jgi:hypothetical protein